MRKAKEYEGDIAKGKLPGVVFDRVMYTELAEDLKNWYRLKGRKSLDRLQLAITHLDKSFEDMRVVEITTEKSPNTPYSVKRKMQPMPQSTGNSPPCAV